MPLPLKHSDYLPTQKYNVGKAAKFSVYRLAFCDPVKSDHQPDPSPNNQICAKSMARWPNLMAKSVVRWLNLLQGGQICGMAAKSMTQRPSLWHGGEICGTAAKSKVLQPNLWDSS